LNFLQYGVGIKWIEDYDYEAIIGYEMPSLVYELLDYLKYEAIMQKLRE
jgi:hypothetical protein